MNVEETAAVTDRLRWSKSSYSGAQGGECVEVATCPHTVHVRDSKDRNRRGLALGSGAWAAFLGFAADRIG
ncbi:DUF397 domain-containing protein [Streptomyces sp. NPDC005706]|uniref:DUF397 domain-containing protein n=1 Tax=Streptomyces sp. NPDC005706 TaxID=3157169 RepID=UPI0033FFF011